MAKAVSNFVTKLPSMVEATIAYSKPRLEKFGKYAAVELVPPKPGEFGQVMQGFNQLMRSARTGAWKRMSVREATLNTCVGLEVFFCFFIGECIGKRHFVGYDV